MNVIPIAVDYYPCCESCVYRGSSDCCDYCNDGDLWDDCEQYDEDESEIEDRLAA